MIKDERILANIISDYVVQMYIRSSVVTCTRIE